MKNLEELIENLKTDEDLRSRLAAAGDDQDALNKVLADEGYAVTGSDIMEFSREKALNENPSEEDLRQVAGGFWVSSPGISTNLPSGIACTIVGAGATCWMSFGREED